jgi:hypothetical protein
VKSLFKTYLFLYVFTSVWANDFFVAAEQRILEIVRIDDPVERHDSLQDLALELMKTDPAAAFKLVFKIKDPEDRTAFSSNVLRRWGRLNPQAALDACNQYPADGEMKSYAIAAALGGWATTNPNEAIAWVETHLKGQNRRAALGSIAVSWARTQPLHAAQWASKLPNRMEVVAVLGVIMEKWAYFMPFDAAEWASRIREQGMKDLMMSKVLFRWSDFYPLEAAQWLADHPAENWLLPRVAARWGRIDPNAAIQWIKKQPQTALMESCKSAMAVEWAYYSPEAAYNWVGQNVGGDLKQSAQGEIIETWTSDYPLECLVWSQGVKDPEERARVSEQITSSWARNNRDDFQKWLEQQPAGTLKDTAIKSLAELLSQSEPEKALNTLLQIKDNAVKKANIIKVFGEWEAIEPSNAEQWLLDHPAVQAIIPSDQPKPKN